MASDAHGGGHVPNFPGPSGPSGNEHGGAHVPRSFVHSTGSSTVASSQSYRPPQSTIPQQHAQLYPHQAGYQQTQPYQQVQQTSQYHYTQHQQQIRPVNAGYAIQTAQSTGDRKQGFAVTQTSKEAAEAVDEEKYATAAGTLVAPINRATFMKGYRHFFHACQTTLKWKFPNLYQPAGYEYADDTTKRNRDCFSRVYEGHLDDRYISSYDGKIKKLVVQTTDRIYDNSPCNSTYRRTFIRNRSPWILRIANWPTYHIDYRKGPPTSEDVPLIILKWIPATVGLLLALGLPMGTPPIRNPGHYDPFPYRYFGVPKVVRNLLEEPSEHKRALMKKEKAIQPILQERILRPRWLCFLHEPTEKIRKGVVPMEVEKWMALYGASASPEYLVVTYVSTQFDSNNAADMDALDEIAEMATRAAGLSAYWIASSCMVEENQRVDDVFRISDVIRGAHSTVIAVGPSKRDASIVTTEQMLREWGSRVWTFPEVLLSREGRPITIYTRNGDLARPKMLSKYKFAEEVWSDPRFMNDGGVSRELIDHYEGNLILNRLELVTLAMKCLYGRMRGEKFKGDHAYALMGLLSTRPPIDPSDSEFQAFARLSLANDSDLLLERLICVLPADPNQEWHNLNDAYGAQLWEIDPQIQISGIGSHNENPNTPDDTVIIDGCHAANIRWKCFTPVASSTIISWKRLFATYALRTSGYNFFLGIILVALGIMYGAIFLVWAIPQLLAAPYLVRTIYGGKFWGQQPWFFGFEGYLDIEAVERQIFGARSGRLSWSLFGSPLSRHRVNEHGEYESLDPTTDPEVKKLVERAEKAGPGERRIFTLVDTYAMTVTLFEATRPPIAFLLVGSESGMKRAMGVSYDWSTSTLYRETVLRFETTVQDAMYRIPRAKVGLRRPFEGARQRTGAIS